jgi:hypothetical protein
MPPPLPARYQLPARAALPLGFSLQTVHKCGRYVSASVPALRRYDAPQKPGSTLRSRTLPLGS